MVKGYQGQGNCERTTILEVDQVYHEEKANRRTYSCNEISTLSSTQEPILDPLLNIIPHLIGWLFSLLLSPMKRSLQDEGGMDWLTSVNGR